MKIILTIIFISILLLGNTNWIRPAQIPQPKDNPLTKEKIELGKILFFDKRLSKNNNISCSSCHNPKNSWTNSVPYSIGSDNKIGERNSPTLINVAYQLNQFWDGRVKTLEEQATKPMKNNLEMNISMKDLIKKLNKIKGYKELFDNAFPSKGITEKTLSKALASFERTIVSNEAPFDEYIKGDSNAISRKAKEGFRLFLNKGKCNHCHDGFNFTDGSFHNLGLYKGKLQGQQLGRYIVKKRSAWYGAMKTPTLRNIIQTYPYFHDGSVTTIEEAIKICGNGGRYKDAINLSSYIVDRKLNDIEINKIVTFLKTLSNTSNNIDIPKEFPK